MKNITIEKIRQNIRAYTDEAYQPLFDHVVIDKAPFDVELFSKPIGVDGKTSEDTNLYVSNMFVKGNEFLMTGVGVYFIPDKINRDSHYDVQTVLGHGYFQLLVQNRRYLEMAPFAALPPPFPMYWAYDIPALKNKLTKARGEGVKLNEHGFDITPLYIPSQTYFGVRLRTANHYQLSCPGKLGVILNGHLIREYQ